MDTFGGSPYYLLCGFNSFKNIWVKCASFPSKNLNSSRNHHAFTFPETNIESEKYDIAKRKPWSSMPLIFRCCVSFKDSETLHIPEKTNMEPSQAGLESSCFSFSRTSQVSAASAIKSKGSECGAANSIKNLPWKRNPKKTICLRAWELSCKPLWHSTLIGELLIDESTFHLVSNYNPSIIVFTVNNQGFGRCSLEWLSCPPES